MSVIYCHGCDTHVDTDYFPSFVTINDEEVCEDCAPACEECNEILEVLDVKLCDDCKPKSESLNRPNRAGGGL